MMINRFFHYYGCCLFLFFQWSDATAAAAIVDDTTTPQEDEPSDRRYNMDAGILHRVTEKLDVIMGLPVQAIGLFETFHLNHGFHPHGLHSEGRDQVLTYLYSLIQSFDGLKLYFGTEQGEYFTYFDTEAVYREPGNAGYLPNDPEMSKYWPICVDGNNGERHNCQMDQGDEYIQCVNDCNLVPCLDEQSQRDCSASSSTDWERQDCLAAKKWCPDYTIEKVQANETRGYVPVSYHCIDEYGLFSQEPGQVQGWLNYDDEEHRQIVSNQTCRHWDETPVTGYSNGKFAYCNHDGLGGACNDTYLGLMRTVEYDPRRRPWYIDTKAMQTANWSPPYPFHTHSNIITRIGITYAHPYYVQDDQARRIFAGVFAVDYTLKDLSSFLTENYGASQDLVVAIVEATEPHYLIGIPTGTSPYREVLTTVESQPCVNKKEQECKTVRVPSTNVESDNPSDEMASLAAQAQIEAGFPTLHPVVAQGSNLFSASYLTQSVKYTLPGTSEEWIVLVASPLIRASSDAILPGDVLFVSVILVASLGVLGCASFLSLWYKYRKKRSVMYGDFVFTSCFIAGCLIQNLCSLVFLGENTEALCIARFWTFNLSFSFVMAPLLVKVYRVYKLVGAGGRMVRRQLNLKQAALLAFPLIAVEIAILLTFTFVDPPRPVEEIDFSKSTPVQHITCQHESNAFVYTDTIYKVALVIAGCILSFLSRNLDVRFGEAKQLLFGMCNIAITGLCVISLISFVDASPDAIHMFLTLGVFWATVLTCAVFVVPRLVQVADGRGRPPQRVSGLDVSGYVLKSSSLPSTTTQSQHLLVQKSKRANSRDDLPFEEDESIVFFEADEAAITPAQMQRSDHLFRRSSRQSRSPGAPPIVEEDGASIAYESGDEATPREQATNPNYSKEHA